MASAAGERRSWAVVALLAALATSRTACAPIDDAASRDPAVGRVLADAWPAVIAPALADAHLAGDALVVAVDAWAGAEDGAGDPEPARAAAQDAWRDAMAAWQVVEVLQVGPLGSALTAVGGADLRDDAYSWPLVNRCRVDQVTGQGGYLAPDFLAVELVNATGLDALETLLFSPPGENVCPSQIDINADGSWAALGVDGVQAARAAYAGVAARGFVQAIGAAEDAFAADGGDFGGALARAGEPELVYASQTEGLNALFDAAFYLESATQDAKLGEPLGLRDCGGTDCLAGVESALSGDSHRWIAQNLVGFRLLWEGGAGYGLDDLLRDRGETALADAMGAALDRADDAAAALTVPIDVAATTDPTAALALHAAVSAVADLLRLDVAAALVLELPSEAAGDND